MLFLGYVAASILLYFAIVRPNEKERATFVSEHTRDLLVNRTVHDAWIKEKTRLVKMKDDDLMVDQQRAKRVFDQLDKNKNGTIDGEEIVRLLREWDVAGSFIERFLRFSKKREISFEIFYRNVWRLGEKATSYVQESKKREDKAKARFVFNDLDTDSSGYIDAIELQKLLIQWGLPEDEVDAYLAEDDDKRFSFEEFYQSLKPIWNFAYEHMKGEDVV
ncbi:unnamed protein product [Rotaria sp. Silwood2]|nr:unnamed protein product [Rotaria sp. Silwood2]CAF4497677.1 unnamed protein product [Rotaria sp. Silwood2]